MGNIIINKIRRHWHMIKVCTSQPSSSMSPNTLNIFDFWQSKRRRHHRQRLKQEKALLANTFSTSPSKTATELSVSSVKFRTRSWTTNSSSRSSNSSNQPIEETSSLLDSHVTCREWKSVLFVNLPFLQLLILYGFYMLIVQRTYYPEIDYQPPSIRYQQPTVNHGNTSQALAVVVVPLVLACWRRRALRKRGLWVMRTKVWIQIHPLLLRVLYVCMCRAGCRG